MTLQMSEFREGTRPNERKAKAIKHVTDAALDKMFPTCPDCKKKHPVKDGCE